jgi:gamma-glutamyltranspeptidase/glutathione hydrolase
MPDGFIPPVGDIVRQPALAKTLRRLADEGPDYFIRGEWAERFVDEVNRTGGHITLRELSDYQVRWVPPVRFSYRGHELAGAPPASTAGVLNGMIFNILEQTDLQSIGHYTKSAESFVLIRKAYEQAELFTTSFIGDPLALDIPVDNLLDKSFGRQLAKLIAASDAQPQASANLPARGAPSIRESYAADSGRPHAFSDTNHLVIVDKDGNWVSMTHTVYGDTFGTGLTVDGVGVNSGNNFPGTSGGAGRRVITPFPALMSLDEDGKPWLAIGSPGLSSRAVALTIINLLGYDMAPYDAVDAPRFQGYGRYDKLHVESRIPDAVLDELEARGTSIQLSAPYNWHMGSIQLVIRDKETGMLQGVADPRRAGHVEGY